MLRLREIVVALAAAWVIATFVACGASSANAANFYGEGGPFDSGYTAEDSTVDGPLMESGTLEPDAAADAPLGADGGVTPPTSAVFVHASPDLGDMRLCWRAGTAAYANAPAFPDGAPAAASNYPAIPVGGSASLADATSLLGGDLTIVAISAAWLHLYEDTDASTADCSTLMGMGGSSLMSLHESVTTFTVPAGTVVAGETNVIALAGCPLGDTSGTVARCGAGFAPATGNLHVDVVPLSPVPATGTTQLAVQAAQLSPALAVLAGDAGTVVSYGTQTTTSPIATLAGEGSSGPSMPTVLTQSAGTYYGTYGFGVNVQGVDGGPGGQLWMSLEQSLELIDPMQDPSIYYTASTSYVVAVIGNPSSAFAPDASFDGTGLHILVLPLPVPTQ
jgi:hypothetical protein